VVQLGTISAVASYHEYLQSLKRQFKTGRHSKFWEAICQEYASNAECVFVTQSECKHSTVTASVSEANTRFFVEEVVDSTAVTPPTQTEEEEEDMFGDMM